MNMTSTTMTSPQTSVAPVVGAFDDIGNGERAVHDLHAAGFGRDEVGMEWEEVEVPNIAPPAPRSFAAPFAFVTSLLGGAILSILAAHFAPKSLTLGGVGWQVSPPVVLALVGGTFGWIMGAILGYGHIAYEEEPPGPISLQTPIIAVSVLAPSRPSEARAILRSAGAREIQGGDRAYPSASVPQSPSVPTRPAQPQPRREAARGPVTGRQRVPPATPTLAPERHARLPLGPQGTPEGTPDHRSQRTGLALILAVVAGAVVALLRRRD